VAFDQLLLQSLRDPRDEHANRVRRAQHRFELGFQVEKFGQAVLRHSRELQWQVDI
jgi:hypothetical protein